MSIETEQFMGASAEREKNYESKESKEAEVDPELKAAAAMERADYLVGEVKNSKKQVQNIVMHMTQVLATIKQLRKQLQLADSDDESAVAQDKERVTALKERIAEYKDEILKMKDELIAGQMQELQKEQVSATDETLRAQAEEMVSRILAEVES